MTNNRVGSSCCYREYDRTHKKWGPWKLALLLAWSIDHDETEYGPALFPVAVIEDFRTMEVKSVPVSWITFSPNPEESRK